MLNSKVIKVILSGFLSAVLALYMPAMAFADTYYIETGNVTINAHDDGQYVSQENNDNVTNKPDNDPVISNTNPNTSSGNTVTIEADQGQTANVTFSGLNICTSNSYSSDGPAAVTVSGGGSVSIELNGNNSLISGNLHAGIEDQLTGMLTINDVDNDGSLTAIGGFLAAGIGGAGNPNSTTIINNPNANAANITINGGEIRAFGHNAAGIGGGGRGNGTDITINGGNVTAMGHDGAGIGGGTRGNGTNITITGGSVTALGSGIPDRTGGRYGDHVSSGAGIGGGVRGNGTNITISGGTVVAIGGEYGGAGIGGGAASQNSNEGRGSNIIISGAAQVSAAGGSSPDSGRGAGAAIGNGSASTGLDPGAEVAPNTTGLTGSITYYSPGSTPEAIGNNTAEVISAPEFTDPVNSNPANPSQQGGSVAAETSGNPGENSNVSGSTPNYSTVSTSSVTAASVLAQITNALAIDPGATSVNLDLGTDPSLGVDAIRALCEGNSVVKECHFTHDGKKFVLIIPVVDKESPIYKLCLELLAQEPGGTAGPIKLSQIFAPVGFDLKEE